MRVRRLDKPMIIPLPEEAACPDCKAAEAILPLMFSSNDAIPGVYYNKCDKHCYLASIRVVVEAAR